MEEKEMEKQLASQGFKIDKWNDPPSKVYEKHAHEYSSVIFCLKGSIEITTYPGNKKHSLEKGSKFTIPANMEHSAVVGPSGVTCIEGQKQE